MAHAPSNAGSSAGAAAKGDASTPVVIKKYANRRLYNTETSSYIPPDHLAGMTREGRHFQVFDASTKFGILREVPPSDFAFTDDKAPVEEVVDQIILNYVNNQ